MPEFLQASIQVLLGIGLLFGGGELFVQGAVAMAVGLLLGVVARGWRRKGKVQEYFLGPRRWIP